MRECFYPLLPEHRFDLWQTDPTQSYMSVELDVNPIREITDRNNQLLAIILSGKFDKPGIHFFTSNTLSQQLGYMRHPVGKAIAPHVHNIVHREVYYTQEVLFIKKGKLRVDFYCEQQHYLESRILEAGDVILLIKGGHGFEVLEEVEMVEVKQGPYMGDRDKTRFDAIAPEQVKIVE